MNMDREQPTVTPQNAGINPPMTTFVLGPQPGTLVCPSCRQQVTSKIQIENTMKTHLIAIVLCLLCCPCVFIPYCNDSCKAKNHYCPNCQAYLGSYNN